ncbi:MAG: sugar transferase [Chlorobiota bacterium]
MADAVTYPASLTQRRWRWKSGQHSPVVFQLGVDLAVLVLGTLGYLWVRFASGWLDSVATPTGGEVVAIVSMLTGYWVLLFWLAGLYRNWYSRPPLEELWAVVRSVLLGIALLLVLVFWDSGDFYRSNFRAVAGIYAAFLGIGLGAGRLAVRALQRSLRQRGILVIPALLVGNPRGIERLLEELRRIPHWGYRPLGVVLPSSGMSEQEWNGKGPIPVLGTIAVLRELIRRWEPEELLLAFQPPDPQEVGKVVGIAEEARVGVKMLPELYRVTSGQARIRRLYGTSLLELNPEILNPWQAFVKRTLDIVISALILFVGAPLWLLIAAAIWVDSGRPIFFVQERVGRHGRIFRLYKFRTMLPEGDPSRLWTQRGDPRITRVGRWLRKTYLDEIPQFWNVLKGEMSIVGPRPERPYYVELFTQMVPEYPRRHCVKPGITGWWQVCRRQELNVPTVEGVRSRLEMDFYYIENQSLALDLEIMLRTVWVMLTGKGV